MSKTVAMIAPVGFSGTVTTGQATPPSSGSSYTPDANGQVLVDPLDVVSMLRVGFVPAKQITAGKVATADNGTTQTLTAAMISGASETIHVTTGGTTPSLTLPLATDLAAAAVGMGIGDSYLLRIINSNSGTATVVTNTGWTTSGTLTIAANTWRDFVITKTAAGTFTITSVGTGTNS